MKNEHLIAIGVILILTITLFTIEVIKDHNQMKAEYQWLIDNGYMYSLTGEHQDRYEWLPTRPIINDERRYK